MERELSDTCVSRSTYLGCYENRNNNRALPHEIDGRGHTARECENACADKGFLYFAREWRGQCFCSNADNYDKHGTANNCDCCGTNVGANKMCVYKLQSEAQNTAAPGCTDKFHDAPYMGCYEDRNKNRALPHEVNGKYHSAEDCHEECTKAGYTFFARQWRGQCFCGNEGYDKYGSATNCDCCGRDVGPNKMCVWQGEGGGGGDVAGGGDSETEIGVEDDGQGGESDTEGVPSGEEGGVVESEGEGDGGDVSGSGGESEGEGEVETTPLPLCIDGELSYDTGNGTLAVDMNPLLTPSPGQNFTSFRYSGAENNGTCFASSSPAVMNFDNNPDAMDGTIAQCNYVACYEDDCDDDDQECCCNASIFIEITD